MKTPGRILFTEIGAMVSTTRTGSELWATSGTAGGATSRAGSQGRAAYAVIGVRPFPAAAICLWSRATEDFNAASFLNISAPGDGRTPSAGKSQPLRSRRASQVSPIMKSELRIGPVLHV